MKYLSGIKEIMKRDSCYKQHAVMNFNINVWWKDFDRNLNDCEKIASVTKFLLLFILKIYKCLISYNYIIVTREVDII